MSRLRDAVRDVVTGGAHVLGTLVAAPLLRSRYRRWGADPVEVEAGLPGDDLVPVARLAYTRAITIDAPVEAVWPWVVQMGQGRGGFYSYDGLENLVGCRIHSADVVLPELQDVRPGDLIRLAAGGGPVFRVHEVHAPTSFVLVSDGPTPVADAGATVATWQWALRQVDDGRRTRLIVRQRLTFPDAQRVMWHLVDLVGFAMEQRMLHGIKRRAERARDDDGDAAERVPGGGRRAVAATTMVEAEP